MVRKHTVWHMLAFIGLALFLGACSGAMAAELPEELPESVEVEIEDGRQELEFTGTLDAQAGQEWTVSGVTFAVTPDTEVHAEIEIGDSVKVHAFLDAEGNLTAREVEPVDANGEDEDEIEFTGTVESQEGSSWMIDGTVVLIVPSTEVKGAIEVGDLVKVQASPGAAGSLVAREIEPADAEDRPDAEDDEGEFEFTGTVESIGPEAWTIGGRTVAVTPATEIEPGLSVGDLVKVHASRTEAGTLTAREIDPAELDDDDLEEDEGEVEFVGVIESVSGTSVVVDGLTIQITDATEIEADLTVGNTVKVEAFTDSDGTLIAEEIEDADEDDREEAEFDDEDEVEDDHDDDDDDDNEDEHEDDEDRSGSNSGSG